MKTNTGAVCADIADVPSGFEPRSLPARMFWCSGLLQVFFILCLTENFDLM
jgi:hypothetical protein